MTITEKRAKLFKEWTLATMANDERYYLRTLALGIPDGTTSEEAFYDIEHGEYDEDIAWACVPQCIRCGACIEPFSNCDYYYNLTKYETIEKQVDIMKRYDFYNSKRR